MAQSGVWYPGLEPRHKETENTTGEEAAEGSSKVRIVSTETAHPNDIKVRGQVSHCQRGSQI